MATANIVFNTTLELLERPPCHLATAAFHATTEKERAAIGGLLAAYINCVWLPPWECRCYKAAGSIYPALALLTGAATRELLLASRVADRHRPREKGISAAGVLGCVLGPIHQDASHALCLWSAMGPLADASPMYACCIPIHYSANALDNHLSEALATHYSAHNFLRLQCTAPDVAAIVRGLMSANARQPGPAMPRDIIALHALLDLFWKVDEDTIMQARAMWANTAAPTIHGRYYFYTRLLQYRGLLT